MVHALYNQQGTDEGRVPDGRDSHVREGAASIILEERTTTKLAHSKKRNHRCGQLLNNEEQEQTSAGFGISLRNITPQIARQLGLSNDVTGAVIVNVVAGSPAARAGLSQGDVVLEVNRNPVRNSTEVSQALNSVPSGGIAFMLILRNGQEVFVTVTKQ